MGWDHMKGRYAEGCKVNFVFNNCDYMLRTLYTVTSTQFITQTNMPTFLDIKMLNWKSELNMHWKI